jgi:CubicO group peptidase (beta-lactamase class C family)
LGTDIKTNAPQLAGFDEWINEQLRTWKVPGVGIAVVKDGKVLLAAGYGLRNVEKGLAADGDTVFAIGSASKAFTTMAMAMLADEGKLDWDKPVREYIPDFRMWDAWATERMTPRDLTCHRSGLPRHDLVWIGMGIEGSRRDLVANLRHLEPNRDFRTHWQYQNLMYVTAGYVCEAITGKTWEALVQEKIFDALGMSTSNFSPAKTQTLEDYSLAYSERKDVVMPVPFRVVPMVGPAGTIMSTPKEMANWALFQLGQGKFGDKQLLSAAQATQQHSPQMVISGAPETARLAQFSEIGAASYGLGWFINDYRGHKSVHHGGNIDGFSALVAMLPDQNLGVVVLTNLNGNMMPTVVAYNVFDRFLGLEPVDWTTRVQEIIATMKKQMAEQKAKTEADRVPDTRPSHALEDYVGVYAHPAYGRLTITKPGDSLQATLGNLVLAVTHYHFDRFSLRLEAFEMEIPVMFGLDGKGSVATASVPLDPTVKPIVFARVDEK